MEGVESGVEACDFVGFGDFGEKQHQPHKNKNTTEKLLFLPSFLLFPPQTAISLQRKSATACTSPFTDTGHIPHIVNHDSTWRELGAMFGVLFVLLTRFSLLNRSFVLSFLSVRQEACGRGKRGSHSR